jgi:hypothetical protein
MLVQGAFDARAGAGLAIAPLAAALPTLGALHLARIATGGRFRIVSPTSAASPRSGRSVSTFASQLVESTARAMRTADRTARLRYVRRRSASPSLSPTGAWARSLWPCGETMSKGVTQSSARASPSSGVRGRAWRS